MSHDLASILTLALGGTLIGTFVVGAIVRPFLDVPWPAALAFGAPISARDPVAVIALSRSLGVTKRLTTLVEGESLFNDGAAIVIFNLAVAGAVGGTTFSLGGALWDFVSIAFGGIAVGLVLGYAVSNLVLKNLDDHLVETAVAVALAFGSYLIAEGFGLLIGADSLHLSGILAVVAAGLVVGEIGLQNTSPTTRLALENFWEFARALIVYGTMFVQNRIKTTANVPVPYQHVMFWGGLRGAVSLALALTLSASFDAEVASVLELATFGIVLFTLLVQGTTINALINRLGLAHRSLAVGDQQRHQAAIYGMRAGRRELERLRREGVVLPQLWSSLAELYEDDITRARVKLDRHFRRNPGLETAMFLQARADSLNAERRAVLDANRRGLISAEVAEEVSQDLVHRLAALEFLRSRFGIGQAVEGDPEQERNES